MPPTRAEIHPLRRVSQETWAGLVGEAGWWGVTHLSTSGQSPASQCNLLGSSLLFSGSFFAAKAENPSCALACSYQSRSTVVFTPGDEWPQDPSCPCLLAPVWSTHRVVTCYAVRRSRAAPGPSMGEFTPSVMHGHTCRTRSIS